MAEMIPLLARSASSPLFGKCNVPVTVNLSDSTHAQLITAATLSGVPVSEYLRAMIEVHFFGVAEVMRRSCQRLAPGAMDAIAGDSQ